MRLPAAILGLSTLLSAQSKTPPESLLFTNVNIVDTRQGRVERNMTVLVEEGHIRSIARYGLIAGGRGLRVVNAAGKYLIPGLWDMHAHTAEQRAGWHEKIIYPLYLANGVTAVRDMGGDPVLLNERRQRLEQGELIGPHIFREMNMSSAVTNPAEDAQLDSVQTLSDLPRDSYATTSEQISGLRVPARVSEPDSAADLAARGTRSSLEQLGGVLLACSSQEQTLREQRLAALAHSDLDSYSLVRLKTLATYDPQKARSFFLELATHATWQVPTLVWSQTMARLDDPQFPSDPRLAYVPGGIRSQWDPKFLLRNLSAEQFASVRKEAARDLELVNAMHRIGVQFMTGTDAPDPYVIPGFSLHDELEWMVKTGFTATQALQAATFNPALFMVKLDQYGMVEKDHVADLVLLDANPLEDIRNTRKISAVVLGGRYFSRSDLDRMLREVREQAAKE
jgi:amidohydrolase family protein